MIDLTGLLTETRNQNTMHFDEMTSIERLQIMNEEDAKVIEAIKAEIPKIAKVVDWCTNQLAGDGRLIYIGAGTSGRLGLLDAVECPPTFGVDSGKVIGLIAGGNDAFIKAVENAEDREELAIEDLQKIKLTAQDVVVGIAASGRTPYVIGGLRHARAMNCRTAAVVCNRSSEMTEEAEIVIELIVGPEVLTGSTRLKAGTAQKMVCNMISTASMVGIGKAYENLMVDVVQTNAKLVRRAENIVIEATGCKMEMAAEYLKEAEGSAKTAIVAILSGCTVEEAKERLEKAKGHVRNAITP